MHLRKINSQINNRIIFLQPSRQNTCFFEYIVKNFSLPCGQFCTAKLSVAPNSQYRVSKIKKAENAAGRVSRVRLYQLPWQWLVLPYHCLSLQSSAGIPSSKIPFIFVKIWNTPFARIPHISDRKTKKLPKIYLFLVIKTLISIESERKTRLFL